MWVDALEIAEEVQVLLDRHEIEQNVVLRANSHDLPQVRYIFLEVGVRDASVNVLSTQAFHGAMISVDHAR